MTTTEPIHPGEHLSEIMNELGITQYRLAKTMGMPPIRIHDIVHRRRSITADTALRLGQALGMTSRLLVEPSADVRPGSGPHHDRHKCYRTAGGGGYLRTPGHSLLGQPNPQEMQP